MHVFIHNVRYLIDEGEYEAALTAIEELETMGADTAFLHAVLDREITKADKRLKDYQHI